MVSGNKNCLFWRFLYLASAAKNVPTRLCQCRSCHLLKIRIDWMETYTYRLMETSIFFCTYSKYSNSRLNFASKTWVYWMAKKRLSYLWLYWHLLVLSHLSVMHVLGIASSSKGASPMGCLVLLVLLGAAVCPRTNSGEQACLDLSRHSGQLETGLTNFY